MSIDLGPVARDLGLPAETVQRTLELLDEGNTVPFITRFRKDQTGGLDEEQVRCIHEAATRLRQLADRKQTILKSVESQGKLTAELAEQIASARSVKHLEDLYLPFKPKKQTLATLARQRGLEPFSEEILAGVSADLTTRAADFVSTEIGLHSVEEVLTGVGHLLAEKFGDRADLRSRLRRVMQRTGRIVSLRIENERKLDASNPLSAALSPQPAPSVEDPAESGLDDSGIGGHDEEIHSDVDLAELEHDDAPDMDEHEPVSDDSLDDTMLDELDGDESATAAEVAAVEIAAAATGEARDIVTPPTEPTTELPLVSPTALTVQEPATGDPVSGNPVVEGQDAGASSGAANRVAGGTSLVSAAPAVTNAVSRSPLAVRIAAKQQARAAAREAKKKKRQKLLESAFKDYYNFQEPLGKIPHHRILAINRGERARVLRVKIDVDSDAISREAEELLIPGAHPNADFLRGCLKDALVRLVVPSLEREIRRELTERAESHAVDVFVRNLRKLLLQPPVRNRNVLAIDPGFRSGCKLTAINEFGNVLDHGMIHVIGSDQHRQLCRHRLVEMIKKHSVSVVAIGNGTACRETEVLIAEILTNELADRDVAYVIVNEAGASVYSTSPIGREELPKYDVTVRSAVSIGRRLLDPLSELVKINPANIGVGLYQHDVKAKHLRDSLDAVVESCVNFVGVDVNTASPALLRYVSGLNQLTARRLYEYRLQHGPFSNREQFKQVPGFGDATFVQSAGFLKIIGGDNPLDATWIHPESYDVACRVLEKLGASVEELVPTLPHHGTPASDNHGKVPFGAEASPEGIELKSEPIAVAVPDESAAQESAAQESAAQESAAQESAAQESANPITAVETQPIDAEVAGQSEPVVAAPEAPVAVVDQHIVSGPAEVARSTESDSDNARGSLAMRISAVHSSELARELGIGQMLLDDILASLARPARDPREDLPPPVFRRGIMKLEDLTSGMELSGTVLNVVDFGAFVDIGLSDSALVHISRLADRFIRDPHEVVGVGDILTVWVVDVDRQRRRVSLTAIRPGSQRPQEQRHSKPVQKAQTPRPPRSPDQARQAPANTARPPAKMHRTDRPQERREARPPRYKQPPSKPKPMKPITKKMIDGKEPMRTFSDLLQFYQHKPEDDAQPPSAGSQGS